MYGTSALGTTAVAELPAIEANPQVGSLYRYLLSLEWGTRERTVAWVMLHPPVSDSAAEDSMTNRIVGLSRRWGFDRAHVVNLFAHRAARAEEIREVVDPVGPENPHFVHQTVINADLVVVGWGDELLQAGPRPATLDDMVRLRRENTAMLCFGRTEAGQPVHPELVTDGAIPVVWNAG